MHALVIPFALNFRSKVVRGVAGRSTLLVGMRVPSPDDNPDA